MTNILITTLALICSLFYSWICDATLAQQVLMAFMVYGFMRLSVDLHAIKRKLEP